MRNETCCFTGHRDIPAKDAEEVRESVRNLVLSLVSSGVTTFVVGGAMGFDMLSAELLISLRDDEGLPIRLVSELPFPQWREKWPPAETRRQDQIMEKSDEVRFAAGAHSRDAYLTRDRLMVDGSCCCVAYCRRFGGGTAYTVRYALKQGLKVYNTADWDLSQLREKDSRSAGDGTLREPDGTEDEDWTE